MWEKTTIGEMAKIFAGQSPSSFQDGDELYVKVDDLNSSYWLQNTSKQKVKAFGKVNLIPKGSVVFPKRGAAILTNKIRVLEENAYIDTNLMALYPKKEIDSNFLLGLIENNGLYDIADTSTIPQINNKHIEPYMEVIPRLEEQLDIAKISVKIVELLEKTTKEIDAISTMKHSLLQKMFV